MGEEELDLRRTNIGGRYGSPTVTIAWPFSNVVNADTELRDAVADLALLVSRLATPGIDETEIAIVHAAAEELGKRLGQPK